jgi:hypothetical protein
MDNSILTAKDKQVAGAVAVLAKAEGEVKRLEALQSDQITKESTLQAELEQLEAEMGSKVLAAAEAGEDISETVSTETATVRARLDVAKAVSLAIVPKIAGAKKVAIKAKADVLRFEADRLDQEVSRRQAKTERMLKDLEDWEGCAYVFDAGMSQPSMWGGKRQGGSPDVVYLNIPFTAQLANRAAGLRADADALEQGYEMPTGIVTGNPLAPFNIDYEAGRVLIPEPVEVAPIKHPVPTKTIADLLGLTKKETVPDIED